MNWQEHLISILDPSGTLPIGVIGDETGEPSYDLLIWGNPDAPKPTREEFDEAVRQAYALSYRGQRRNAYPPITEQLDMIFHGGIDEWREQIQAVKDQFPKESD